MLKRLRVLSILAVPVLVGLTGCGAPSNPVSTASLTTATAGAEVKGANKSSDPIVESAASLARAAVNYYKTADKYEVVDPRTGQVVSSSRPQITSRLLVYINDINRLVSGPEPKKNPAICAVIASHCEQARRMQMEQMANELSFIADLSF